MSVIEHNNTLVSYLGFAVFQRDSQGNLINTGSGSTVLTLSGNPVMQYYADIPNMQYDGVVTVYSPSLDFSGTGVGVTFNPTPVEIPEDLFDTGIEQYILTTEPPVYVPMDTSGMTPADEMPGILDAFWLGWAAGDAEVTYKMSLPVAWVLWKDEFETLARNRDEAWKTSGLDDTTTQYVTQAFANGATAALYAAVLRGPITRALGDKMLPDKQWTHMITKYEGFETMAAGAKYELLVHEFGLIRTLIPSWRGILLGTTTKMPLKKHLPSITTVGDLVVGTSAVSASTHGVIRLNFPECEWLLGNKPSMPTTDLEE